jgi:hypothetical protein
MTSKYTITKNHGLDIKGVKAVYTTVFFLQEANLWSGDETDPISWTYLMADNLAVDEDGRLLPYDVTVSFFPINFDRSQELIEFVPKERRRMIQSAAVHLVVFKDLDSYVSYMENENCLIQQD